jgi:hypothetical protein
MSALPRRRQADVRRTVAVSAVLLALVLATVVAARAWSHNGERAILETADQLRVPGTWELVSQHVQPPRLICLGGDACPSLSRRWNVPTRMTTEELDLLVAASGWALAFTDPLAASPGSACAPRPNGSSGTTSCSATGHVDGYSASLYYTSRSDDPAQTELSLFLSSRLGTAQD